MARGTSDLSPVANRRFATVLTGATCALISNLYNCGPMIHVLILYRSYIKRQRNFQSLDNHHDVYVVAMSFKMIDLISNVYNRGPMTHVLILFTSKDKETLTVYTTGAQITILRGNASIPPSTAVT